MVREQLPFTPATARKLMVIARHPLLTKHVKLLPPHWRVLHDLTTVPLDVLRAKIEDGTVTPKISYREVAKLRGPQHRRATSSEPPITACVTYVRARIEEIGAARVPPAYFLV
jgi:hypothetical protein